MRVLLDTELLLWAASEPKRLPAATRRIIEDPHNQPVFSAASLWEVSIKSGLGRAPAHAAEPNVDRKNRMHRHPC
jgi:PIN domain nuclease of toxin-antitoxin system